MMEYFFMGGFEIMFLMVFVLIFGMILVMIVRGIGEWGKNNRSPRLDVSATVFQTYTYHEKSKPYKLFQLLCYLSGGKRRPDGTQAGRKRVWAFGRGR